jgi:lambda family phage minor tail protein L
MAVPTSALQGLTNKSIIELYSVELKADIHYTKTAKTTTYSQSTTTITISLTGHGFSAGLILSLNFTSGNGIDGVYTIQTVSTDSFTVTGTTSQLTNQTTALSDLAGAKVTRRRALSKDLDEVNFPSNVNPYKSGSVDPSAELPREVYFIERKTIENRNIVQFELVSSFDLFGISAPKKLVTRADFPAVGTLVNF